MTVLLPAAKTSEPTTDSSIFERAIDALPDGVLLVNADRKMFYTNAAFRRLWKIPDALLTLGDEAQNLRFVMAQLVDPDGFLTEVERLHPTSEISEDEITFKDGRIILRRSLPFQEDGRFRARIWIFTDITEAKQASVDHLTQLPNRLAFSREFPPFVTSPSDGLLRSVAIVDIDHFKRYNDLYGHARGDEVLGEVGGLLRSYVRESGDLAFRIGGEEFLMATRIRKSHHAQLFFDGVRKSVMAMNVRHDGNAPHGLLTVSIGYGVFPAAPDASAVFRCVDEALYHAKAGGRNQLAEAIL